MKINNRYIVNLQSKINPDRKTMRVKMTKKLLFAITLLTAGVAHSQEFVEGAATNGVVPGGASWADSYSVDGKCYISSGFDHGAGDIIVPTPIGGQTVRQVAERLGPGPGRAGNPLYNDVQCGNGPANNAGDEDFGQCPGRVDQGADGCGYIGPKWDLASAYASAPVTPVVPSVPEVVSSPVFGDDSPACDATGRTAGIAQMRFNLQCPGVPVSQRDCDPIFLNNAPAFMCANYRLGSGPFSIRPKPSDDVVSPVDPIDPVTPENVPDPVPAPAPTVISNQACTGNSRAAVIQQCGNVPVDCDRIDGVLQCANYQLGSGAPAGVPTLAQLTGQTDPEPPVVDPEPPITDPVDPTEPRSVLAPSAAAGYALFLQTYGVPAVDCDLEGGQYRCSDNQIGSGRPGNPGTGGGGTTDPVDPIDPVVNGGTITVEAESFNGRFDGTKQWDQQTEIGQTGMKLTPDIRVTHDDPSAGNFWNFPSDATPYLSYTINVEVAGTYDVQVRALSKGTEDNGAHMWVNGDWALQRIQWCGGKNEWTYSSALRLESNHCGVQGSAQVNLNAGINEIRLGAREDGLFVDKFQFIHVSGSTSLPPLGDATAYLDTFNQPYEDGDLFGAFFDSSFDPDDEQAAIFVRELLDSRPDVDYIVVNGTKKRSHTGILPNSTPIMQDLFPASVFYDVFQNNNACGRPNHETFCQDELESIATQVQLTIENGFRFHIAEGGPSAFTSDLIRELLSRNVSLAALKRIRVVQHSWGWNEEMTTTQDLNVVRQYATYIRIANGNNGPNQTADLNTGINNADSITFRARARSSQYGEQWNLAFNDINQRVDGSDAVETMWILGIPKELAPTPNAFADRYFQ